MVILNVPGSLPLIDILVNSNARETRVALLENAALVELLIERQQTQSIVGNIYKGRVSKILPGMQAAFVDIGLPKAGFLYVADIATDSPPVVQQPIDTPFRENNTDSRMLVLPQLVPPTVSIRELLREGQELLVQITKEPLGTKGCRLTTYLSLAGRHMVLMPGVDHIGVSRRLTDEAEKERLLQCVTTILPAGMGCILRTLSAGASLQDLQVDLHFLLTRWRQLQYHAPSAPVPSLLYQESNVVLRTLRDLFAEHVDRCFIDHPAIYLDAQEFVRVSSTPQLATKIHLYREAVPLFDAFAIEKEIDRALHRKVWLKSGGYITIDHTEALVAIDVNTGRFVGHDDFESTILRTNLEAAHEIARQIRLRNLGGLLILDFIDMASVVHREQVSQALEVACKNDRARIKILGISEFGVVEMTRQRARTSLHDLLCEPCTACHGTGARESLATVCSKVFREIQRFLPAVRQARKIQLHVHPEIAAGLRGEERFYLEEIEQEFQLDLVVTADDELPSGQFEVLVL